ncbi:unnamed protein product, partial [Amoebophrya sp. A120]|eukprot:GSA120T00025136001.1
MFGNFRQLLVAALPSFSKSKDLDQDQDGRHCEQLETFFSLGFRRYENRHLHDRVDRVANDVAWTENRLQKEHNNCMCSSSNNRDFLEDFWQRKLPQTVFSQLSSDSEWLEANVWEGRPGRRQYLEDAIGKLRELLPLPTFELEEYEEEEYYYFYGDAWVVNTTTWMNGYYTDWNQHSEKTWSWENSRWNYDQKKTSWQKDWRRSGDHLQSNASRWTYYNQDGKSTTGWQNWKSGGSCTSAQNKSASSRNSWNIKDGALEGHHNVSSGWSRKSDTWMDRSGRSDHGGNQQEQQQIMLAATPKASETAVNHGAAAVTNTSHEDKNRWSASSGWANYSERQDGHAGSASGWQSFPNKAGDWNKNRASSPTTAENNYTPWTKWRYHYVEPAEPPKAIAYLHFPELESIVLKEDEREYYRRGRQSWAAKQGSDSTPGADKKDQSGVVVTGSCPLGTRSRALESKVLELLQRVTGGAVWTADMELNGIDSTAMISLQSNLLHHFGDFARVSFLQLRTDFKIVQDLVNFVLDKQVTAAAGGGSDGEESDSSSEEADCLLVSPDVVPDRHVPRPVKLPSRKKWLERALLQYYSQQLASSSRMRKRIQAHYLAGLAA